MLKPIDKVGARILSILDFVAGAISLSLRRKPNGLRPLPPTSQARGMQVRLLQEAALAYYTIRRLAAVWGSTPPSSYQYPILLCPSDCHLKRLGTHGDLKVSY